MINGGWGGGVQCVWLPPSQASAEDLKDWGVLAQMVSSGGSSQRQMAEGKKDMLYESVSG